MSLVNDFAVERRGEAPSGDCKVGAGSSTGVFELLVLLVRGQPVEDSHRNTVRATQITLHLFLQIMERIETQMVIEALLIASVASLDLSVVPRRSGANELVLDLIVIAEYVKGMGALCTNKVGKFRSVVRLNDLWCITKKHDRSLYKIYRRMAAVFLVCVNKSLSGCFLDYGILIKLIAVFARVTDLGNKFDVHLPLDTDHGGRVIRLVVLGFFLCRFYLFAKAETHENTVEGAGMARIRLIFTQLAVKLAQGYVGIPSMVVPDPLDLLLGMGIRMGRMRTVRFGQKGFSRAVVSFIPPHQRCF